VSKLADAGIKVHVALAPVLPHITDSQESIEAVVRAARNAGAHAVWHNTLHLHEVTREAFFTYLRARRPGLIARYATYYRGKYAPKAVSEAIQSRVGDALRRFPNRAPATIAPPQPRQISLL
jgi:DNA repair photolyase